MGGGHSCDNIKEPNDPRGDLRPRFLSRSRAARWPAWGPTGGAVRVTGSQPPVSRPPSGGDPKPTGTPTSRGATRTQMHRRTRPPSAAHAPSAPRPPPSVGFTAASPGPAAGPAQTGTHAGTRAAPNRPRGTVHGGSLLPRGRVAPALRLSPSQDTVPGLGVTPPQGDLAPPAPGPSRPPPALSARPSMARLVTV